MAQAELRAVVTIGGRVDNTAGRIGSFLVNMGSQIDVLSQKVIDFGQQSVELYSDYDDDLRAIQGKLGDVTRGEMEALDNQMRDWAENTRYHATEVAESVKEAATSGWKLADIYSQLPNLMNLAQAANMGMADSMGYYNSAMAGMNLNMSEGAELIDEWVMTANNTRATVENLGQSMETLGSVAMFTDSKEELLVLLGMMAEYGTVGSEAGTLLRNVMMRLVAPTDKAADALELLGATEEELNELEIGGLTDAADAIKRLGIEVFDPDTGELNSIVDIVEQIRHATKNMTEQEKYDILADIFPQRTIKGILNLLNSTTESYDQLMRTISDSDGYAENVAQLQEGGLGGAIRHAESQWEELKLTVGEALSGDVQAAISWLGDAASALADMGDSDAMQWIIAAGETLAVAGPGLLALGGLIRLLGMVFTPTGVVTLGLLAGVTLANALIKLNHERFEGMFGNLELDADALNGYLNGIETDFEKNRKAIAQWSSAVDTAEEEYKALTATLSSDLMTAALTGATLTEEDVAEFEGIGEGIAKAILAGIENKEAEQLSWLSLLFGDKETPEEEQALSDLSLFEDYYYQDLYSQAETVGKTLREQLVAALADGQLDEYERKAIMATVDRLNQIEAEINANLDQQTYYTQLHKAQNVSWDSAESYLKSNAEAQAEELAGLDQWWDESWAAARTSFEYAREHQDGWDAYEESLRSRGIIGENEAIDMTSWTDADWETSWNNIDAQLAREYQGMRQQIVDKYGNLMASVVDTLMNGSDNEAAWNFLKQLYADGMVTDENGITDFGSIDFGDYFSDSGDIQNMYDQLKAMYGGRKDLTNILLPYADNATAQEYLKYIHSAYATYEELSVWAASHLDDAGNIIRDGQLPVIDGSAYGTAWTEAFVQDVNENPPLAEIDLPDGGKDAAAYVHEAQIYLDENPGTYTIKVTPSYGGGYGGGYGGAIGLPFSVRNTAFGMGLGNFFADGGRATEPSVFGEVPGMAEWAIPEEHTERTRSLLREAAIASGFTWPELISRNGGLNAGQRGSIQIVYSPNIVAQDATGVEQKLKEDKLRLEKWLHDKKVLESVEVYA